MEQTIVRYGYFLWCYWFTRSDGARMVHICIPPIFGVTIARGELRLDDVPPKRIAGYFYDRYSTAFGFILGEEGQQYEERQFVAHVEPSDRFFRWLNHIEKWSYG